MNDYAVNETAGLKQKNAEWYKILSKSAPDAIYSLTSKGVLTYINLGGADLIGRVPELLVWSSIDTVFPPETTTWRMHGLLGLEDMALDLDVGSEMVALLIDIKTHTKKMQHQIEFTRDYQDIGVNTPVWQNVTDIIDKIRPDLLPKSVFSYIDRDEIEILGDPLLERVFYILLENTLHHRECATEIRLSHRASGDELVIVSEETGIEVPTGIKDKIFDRGFGKHTGFGLFLAREILSITSMTLHENGIPGKGARFEIGIPGGSFRYAGDNKVSHKS